MVRRSQPKESFQQPTELGNSAVGSTRFVMTAEYEGHALVIEGWFEAMCVVVLVVHVIIALGHTAWVLYCLETSGAWQNIVELVALAVKSPSPGEKVLENTCAGIDSFQSVGAVAWVEAEEKSAASATGSTAAGVPRHQLRLRFKEDQVTRDSRRVPVVGKKYDRVVAEKGQSLVRGGEDGDYEKVAVEATQSGLSRKSGDFVDLRAL